MMKRVLFLGLGLLSVTREKAEKVIKEMVEKGDISTEEGSGFVEELIKRGEEAKEEIKKVIKDEVEAKCNHREQSQVSREEFEALQQRVNDMEMRLR